MICLDRKWWSHTRLLRYFRYVQSKLEEEPAKRRIVSDRSGGESVLKLVQRRITASMKAARAYEILSWAATYCAHAALLL